MKSLTVHVIQAFWQGNDLIFGEHQRILAESINIRQNSLKKLLTCVNYNDVRDAFYNQLFLNLFGVNSCDFGFDILWTDSL